MLNMNISGSAPVESEVGLAETFHNTGSMVFLENRRVYIGLQNENCLLMQ